MGRKKLFEFLVRAHSTDMFRFACRLCGDRETAADLVQEAYAEAWKSLDSLEREEKARSWLFTILRYRHAHLRRGSGGKHDIHEPLEDHEHALEDESQSVDQEGLERADQLQKALSQLDSKYREPLLMVFLQGMTCEQCAGEMELPLGTVLSRIHRAKRMLQDALEILEKGL